MKILRIRSEEINIKGMGRIYSRSKFSKKKILNTNKKIINMKLLDALEEVEPAELIEESVHTLGKLMDEFQAANDIIRLVSNLQSMDLTWWNRNFQITDEVFVKTKSNAVETRYNNILQIRREFSHIYMGVDYNGNAVGPVENMIEKNFLTWIRAHDHNKKSANWRSPFYLKFNKIKNRREEPARIIPKILRTMNKLSKWRYGNCSAFNEFNKVINNKPDYSV